MNSIELAHKKVVDAFPKLMEKVNDGGYIPAHSDEYHIIYSSNIIKLPMKVLEQNLMNVLAHNENYNSTQSSTLKHAIGRGDTVVVKFFEFITEFKKCIERKSFTDAFEQAIKLKMFLSSRSDISQFVGDSDLGLAMNAISLKITSEFFNVIETMEKEHNKILFDRMNQMLEG